MKQCPECKRVFRDDEMVCPDHGQYLTPQMILDGKYRLEEKIGEGGMGEIYRATHLRLGTTWAVKILNLDLLSDESSVQRFWREAQVSTQINHPNVVNVVDIVESKECGVMYIVMEYLAGKNLKERLYEGHFLTWEEIHLVLRQICNVLDCAHAKGIIHRDLKPDNIFLVDTPEIARSVKVLDFGIAYVGKDMRLTMTGELMGSPEYMSPEHCEDRDMDYRADIYTLGVVLYELLTGDVPFSLLRYGFQTIMVKHLTELPRRIRDIRPDVPEAVEAVVLKALSKNPNQRQQSASQLAQEFEEALSTSGIHVKELSFPLLQTQSTSAMPDVMGAPSPWSLSPLTQESPTSLTNPGTETLDPFTSPLAAPLTKEDLDPVTDPADSLTKEDLDPVTDPADDMIVEPAETIEMNPGPALTEDFLLPSVTQEVNPGHDPLATNPIHTAAREGMLPLRTVSFEVVTLNTFGQVVFQTKRQAEIFDEPFVSGAFLEMIEIPSGSFEMGDAGLDAEQPVHKVSVPTFFISKFAITQAQWHEVSTWPKVERELLPAPSKFSGPMLPVEQITWDDAMEFCARLAKKTCRSYRLPTEAEWEYACRAGTVSPFAFGETLTAEIVNYNGEYPYGQAPKGENRRKPIPVGSLHIPNAFGVYDMHGNVMEWCLDVWHPNYIDAPADGSARRHTDDQRYRVVRGGSWNHSAHDCRSAYRYGRLPDLKNSYLGFRVVMTLSDWWRA